MRTIKFRVWDYQNKKYRTDVTSFQVEEGRLCDVAFENGEDHFIKKEGLFSFPSSQVEQFTGLKDKNGKEIYEGDILNVCNGSINGNGWFDEPYLVEFKCGKWDIPLFMWDKDWQAIMGYSHWCEVIGNIHSNPELLKP